MYILCSPLNHLILYLLHFDHENGYLASLGIACLFFVDLIHTVRNDLINAHFHINAFHRINAPLNTL